MCVFNNLLIKTLPRFGDENESAFDNTDDSFNTKEHSLDDGKII